MSQILKYFLVLLFLTITLAIKAQLPPDFCRVENNRFFIKVDLNWTQEMKKEIASQFALDTILYSKLQDGLLEITLDSISWKVKKLNSHIYEISKFLTGEKFPVMNSNDVFLVEDSRIGPSTEQEETVVFGINNLIRSSVFNYQDSLACFFLPKHLNANRVYLAGTFNDWSTYKTPMQLSDSGWVYRMKLSPGKHTYKYIVDGNWMTDPYNKIKENDGQGNINSVIYCYNYIFKLKGFLNASRVVLAGSFNNWDKNGPHLLRINDGWALPVYLKEGTYAYKFIVDKEWIADPENKDIRADGAGNLNSFLNLGKPYLFRLNGFTSVHQVILSGSFNFWSTNELVMQKTSSGWQLPYVLSPGNYEYKFFVDGKWITDPVNPYTSGKEDHINSLLSLNANYTFILNKFPNAKNVVVTGSFNLWNPDGYRMVRKEGQWSLPIYLKPGKCIYKFIVDGQWIVDPDNKLWEENEYGTGNSVLWVKP